MNQLNIFQKYPKSPGWKKQKTSKAAALSMSERAFTLREKALNRLMVAPATADEIAKKLDVSILAIRPRITELFRLGEIFDTGVRRKNDSGRYAIVWQCYKFQGAA